MSKEDMTGKRVLDTQTRIAIAQCLNLAVEKITAEKGVFSADNIKEEAREFFKIKGCLEEGYKDGLF